MLYSDFTVDHQRESMHTYGVIHLLWVSQRVVYQLVEHTLGGACVETNL